MTPGRAAPGRRTTPGRAARARRRQRVLLVAGARPNFMKIAPLLRELRARPARFEARLVHTGQHYDPLMSEVFFDELEIPRPDIHLGAGSGTHAVQTARIMEAFEAVLAENVTDRVVVVGDVNSTLACSVVAAKMSPPVPVAHVEAGLRSRDLTMPEEINRIVTDALSDLLFTTSADADRNLIREGVPRSRIHRVGNVMIDTLRRFRKRADRSDVKRRLAIEEPYALLTLHRPANVDDAAALRRIVDALRAIAKRLPILFPAHPRTLRMLESTALKRYFDDSRGRLRLIEPLSYLDFLHLQSRARLVLTDSGGIQEETTILGVPCLTLRNNTERPITLTQGTNRLVGTDTVSIVREASRALAGTRRRKPRIPLWDGRAAGRIVRVLERCGPIDRPAPPGGE